MAKKRKEPNYYKRWPEHLVMESDRGAVIMAHVAIDSLLGRMLFRYLTRKCKTPKPLAVDLTKDGTFAPMGFFFNRVKFVRAFTLIDDELEQTLSAIGTLRNKFAHRMTRLCKITRSRYAWFAKKLPMRYREAAVKITARVMPSKCRMTPRDKFEGVTLIVIEQLEKILKTI